MKERIFNFWFGDTDARIYAAFRMAFALVALLNLIDFIPYRYAFFADTGLVDLRAAHSPGHFGMPHFSLFNVFTSETHVDVIFAISAVAMVLLGAGVCTRAAAFWVWIWHLTFTYRSPVAIAGWDDVLRVYSFLVLISPLGARWPWRMKKLAPAGLAPVPVYGLRLMCLQLAVIYLHTALCKLPSKDWINGEVLTYYLMSINARFPSAAVVQFHPLLKVMTWGVLAGEIIVPFLLLFRRTRLWGAVLGISFHIGIFLLSRDLGLFCLTMLILYIPLLDPQSLRWIEQRWQRWREKRSR
ncbi:MAG: HTTM domain-containing protein [Verrucomicrobiales bacterium]